MPVRVMRAVSREADAIPERGSGKKKRDRSVPGKLAAVASVGSRILTALSASTIEAQTSHRS